MTPNSSPAEPAQANGDCRRRQVLAAQVRLLYGNANVGVWVALLATSILGRLQWEVVAQADSQGDHTCAQHKNADPQQPDRVRLGRVLPLPIALRRKTRRSPEWEPPRIQSVPSIPLNADKPAWSVNTSATERENHQHPGRARDRPNIERLSNSVNSECLPES